MPIRILDFLRRVMAVSKIPSSKHGSVEIHGMRLRDLGQVCQLYSKLNEGEKLGLLKLLFYSVFGSRMALVASQQGTVSGFEFYSFGVRDLEENTVHQSFTGVANAAQGKGLGTAIRKHAIRHFGRTALAGISSRVSLSNVPSLRSNEKLGFHVVERYFDPARQEERVYLIRQLPGGGGPWPEQPPSRG
jgi:GNAT superfamily N-acetyltransferase